MFLSNEIDKSPDKYNCDTCRKRKYYLERNCNGDVIPDIEIRDKNIKFILNQDIKTRTEVATNFCPAILFYDEEVMELIELYSLYKDGFLLEEGGVNNQPYWYIMAMQELKSINNYIERKEMEKQNG